MRKLRLIQVQPATDYYAWQVEVNLNSTLELGYNGNYIDVIGAFNKESPIADSWLKLQQKFPYVRFFFYQDDMEVRNYQPAVQANVLKKHFAMHPYLSEEAIFFHDCDFVFTKFFDFTPFLADDKWYFSNTISYVGHKYIDSKGTKTVKEIVSVDGEEQEVERTLLDKMCQVVGICGCSVRGRNDKSGGAQKLMKNVSAEYWVEVETDAISLYNWLLEEKDKFSVTGKNDIQVWTASMWSELWNAWKRGHEVEVPEEFNFAFATDHVDKWESLSFFHNAGVMNDKQELFFKAAYMNKYPYNTDVEVNPEKCSKRYYDLIQEVGKKSVLIS